MKYTTYYEQRSKITASEETIIKETLKNDKSAAPFLPVIVRKLSFAAITTDVSEIHYTICMKNYDENAIYLQRKNIQNGITYKTIAKLSKQECEKILSQDYEWLKNHKQQLCKEFYLQLTVNQLKKGNITEIYKEVSKRKHDFVTITHSVKGISSNNHNFFDKNCYMIPCLSDGIVLLSSKQAVTIPRYIRNMVHMGNENADLADLAYIL